MPQFTGLSATPLWLKQADIMAVYDDSLGDLVQCPMRSVVAPVYGTIYGDAVAANLGAIGTTWTKVTSFDAESGVSYGCTLSHSSDQITLDIDAIVMVRYYVTVYNDTGARIMTARIAKGGTAEDMSYSNNTTASASAQVVLAGQALVSGTNGDVFTLEVAHTSTPTTGNFYVQHAHMSIEFIAHKA